MSYTVEEQERIVSLYKEGLGVCKIAKVLHHDAALVSQVLKEQGLWIQGSRNFTDAEEAEIAKLYQVGGFSAKRIARAYGLAFTSQSAMLSDGRELNRDQKRKETDCTSLILMCLTPLILRRRAIV